MVAMFFYFELARFAVKLVVEEYEREPLVNFFSIFDGHNGLVVLLIRRTRICSSSDNNVTIALIVNSFQLGYSSVLIFNNAVVFGPTASHLPSSICVSVQI